MKNKILSHYLFSCFTVLCQFILLPLLLLMVSIEIPWKSYRIEVEPLIPSLFFIFVVGLFIWRDLSTLQFRNSINFNWVKLNLVILAIFFIYIHWLSSIYPFEPLDPNSLWVKLAKSINKNSGAFTFRYRLVNYLLFILGFLALFEAAVIVTRKFRSRYLLACAAGILFGEYFFNRVIDYLFWQFMKGSVGLVTYGLVKLIFGQEAHYISDVGGYPEVGTHQFNVSIAEPCAGLEGISIFLVSYLTLLWLDRGKYKSSRAVLFGFLGVGAMFLVNIFRIVVLILIGHYFSPELAVGAWHSYSGVVLYAIAVFLLFRIGYKKVVR